jgi:hypothetical protein
VRVLIPNSIIIVILPLSALGAEQEARYGIAFIHVDNVSHNRLQETCLTSVSSDRMLQLSRYGQTPITAEDADTSLLQVTNMGYNLERPREETAVRQLHRAARFRDQKCPKQKEEIDRARQEKEVRPHFFAVPREGGAAASQCAIL